MRSARTFALAAGFAALAGLVGAGSLTGVDQWAVDHAMPGARRTDGEPTLAQALVPLLHATFDTPLRAAGDVVTLPGYVLVSLLVLGACSWTLRRRGREAAALGWLAAWFLGTAVETVSKSALTRPELYRHGEHVVGFDSSYPSGHTLRGVLVAAAIAATWPRLRAPALIWLGAALALLELTGAHTPSDIVGGVLLGTLLALETARLGGWVVAARRLADRTRPPAAGRDP